jgi:hypothetical protein
MDLTQLKDLTQIIVSWVALVALCFMVAWYLRNWRT